MKPEALEKIADKLKAQDLLMQGMQAALTRAAEENVSKEVYIAMLKQFSRIEKLFGYTKDSWSRGV